MERIFDIFLYIAIGAFILTLAYISLTIAKRYDITIRHKGKIIYTTIKQQEK